MTNRTLSMDVRKVSSAAAVIDISGDVTAGSEETLMDAYNEASSDGAKKIVLNFGGLEYMNSGGIGLLVTVLVRANRQGQKMSAYGLTDHYKQIFELTRLDDAISIHDDEASAIA
jgi:anti-sigma B factor antagonist